MKRFVFVGITIFIALLGTMALLSENGRREEDPAPAGSAISLEKQRVLDFWSYYRTATEYRLEGRWEDATHAYLKALELNDAHEDALYYLGNVYMIQGDFENAEIALQNLARLDSNSARAHSQLGVLHACSENESRFDLETAKQYFLRALEINKEETGPLIRLGQIELLQKNWLSAAQYFDAVTGSNEASVEALYLGGYAAWRLRDREKATDLLTQAVHFTKTETPATDFSREGDTKKGGSLELERANCDLFQEHITTLQRLTAPLSSDQAARQYAELERELASITQ